MANESLKKLLKEYEQRKDLAERILENKKKEFFSKYPRLNEIEYNLNKLYLEKSKNILLSKKTSDINSLDEQIRLLKKEKNNILDKLNIDNSFFVPNYECDFCNDTGYITNSDGTSQMCNCLKQKLIDINYNKSNIGNLEKENFDNFNLSLFSNNADTQKYNSQISPRENIKNIKGLSLNFIKNFDNPEEKNLLFCGSTGLGKTYLSNCIAKESLKNNKTVLYQTSPNLLDNVISYRFGDSSLKDFYNNLLNVDLLIIDDLGTESMNNMKFTELFNIINSRILNQNNKITKTIISTNLNLQEILNTYGDRIFSRIIDRYNICKFFGDDLRTKRQMKN